MKFKDVVISEASTEAKVAALALLLDKELIKLADTVLNVKKLQGPQGEQGLQGPKGEQGDRGFDGTNGKDGIDGKDGKDGEDGKQGVGVADAKIDFDGSLVITLTDGTEINAGDVVPLDTAEKIRVIGNGGGTSQSVLDAIAAIQATIATYGTMATQNANAVAITGGSINGTAIGGTTPAAGTFTTLSTGALTATGQTSLGGAAGGESLRAVTQSGQNIYVEVKGGIYGTNSAQIVTRPSGAGSGFNIGNGNAGPVSFHTNDITGTSLQARVAHTASAVNYVQVTGAATGSGNYTTISSQGSDAAVNLRFSVKGTGTLDAQVNSTTRWKINSDGSVDSGISASGGVSFKASATAAQVNYLQSAGGIATNAPILSAQGSDTNISQVFQSKGTGAIDLAAGSSGVNISNGGTVTAITRISGGLNYTSVPTITISAPTTAGGVQATAQARVFVWSNPITTAGTGYTVGNLLTAVGGTGTAYTVTVSSVDGSGGVTGITIGNYGDYTVTPTNPVTFSGGTGSGYTSNMTWTVGTTFNITNAGSGYVEQPTVTFSGGGGSGAAAYATVGAATQIKTLFGSSTSGLSIYTPVGEQVRFVNVGDGTRPLLINGGGAGGSAVAGLYQPTSTATLGFSTNTGPASFYTGGRQATEQFRVAHTASAVNYMQVTGAATGGAPVISAQGSDANVALLLKSKGTYACEFQSSAGTILLQALPVASSVNYLRVSPSVASSAPVLSAQGSDTNIDLTLTPKGTGLVRFGTYTAGAPAATGYISIKAADGTTYKVLVGT